MRVHAQMKYHRQKFPIHNPDEGVWGDCARTVLACLLDKDSVEEVPHFYDGTWDQEGIERAFDAFKKWVEDQGKTLIRVAYLYDGPPEPLVQHISSGNPGLPFILIGESPNGTGHTVICQDGVIIHDPQGRPNPIIGPHPTTGTYQVEFVVPVASANIEERISELVDEVKGEQDEA